MTLFNQSKMFRLFLLFLGANIALSASQSLTFSGKVLITTGFGFSGEDYTTSEIFDVKDPSNQCQNLPNYPLQVDGANGALINDKYPFICGGSSTINSDCYLYNPDAGQWDFTVAMSNPRYRGGHVVVNKDTLWVTGAFAFEDEAESELIKPMFPGGSIAPGPKLPLNLYSQCMLDLGNNNFLIIGGITDEKKLPLEVLFYNMDTDFWTLGPKLATGRVEHSCGLLQDPEDGRWLAAVVGGVTNETPSHSDSVELLEIDLENGIVEGAEWIQGPSIPVGLGNHDSVVIENSLYTFGGETNENLNQVVYRLSYNAGSWEWSTWGQTQLARWLIVAMEVPDEIVTCEK